jgi:hypothetical protein
MPRSKSVSEKMGVKEDSRAVLIKAPRTVIASLKLPKIKTASRLSGTFDYIHIFTKTQTELDRQFARVKKYLADNGMLWISWPKAGKLDSDLNMKSVIKIGYDHGLVESKGIRVDDTWAALKFTHPKTGKTYRNSYGKLKRYVHL